MPTRRTFLKSTAAVAGLSAFAGTLLAEPEPAPAPAPDKKIRFAMVGLGNFNLNQILPSFPDAKLCRPSALVSGHPDKAAATAARYNIDPKNIYSYETYDKIKDNPEIDAVYIALPNSMHAEYTIRAAAAGKHVFCEKPMANGVDDCQQMIDACKKADRKLQIGYRLRFEPHTTAAIEMCRGGKLGKVTMIDADHSFNIAPNQWRLDKKLAGGGPLVDIGVYCINAARYLTGEEPTEVAASISMAPDDPRFKEVERSIAWTMKFPSGALAHCACSYDDSASRCTAQLQAGRLRLEPAYGYHGVKLETQSRGKGPEVPNIPDINQFAAELDHFADCVINNKTPIVAGEEGLKDVRIIRAIYHAAETGATVRI